VLHRRAALPGAVAAGALAAGAILTRIDAAPTAGVLLLAWTAGQGGAWRRSLPAWATLVVLVGPLLAGYRLQRGEALAPLGSAMGGDMHERIDPLLRLEYPAGEVVGYFASGSLYLYGQTVFGHLAGALRPVAGGLALALVLGAWLCALALLLRRGPRLPALLAIAGAYAPPFAFIANWRPWPYTDRYTYLVMPAAFAVLGWGLARGAPWLGGALRRLLDACAVRAARAGKTGGAPIGGGLRWSGLRGRS
jgi:hypothetical protein